MHIRPFFYILWIPVTIFTWYALSGYSYINCWLYLTVVFVNLLIQIHIK